MKIPRCSNSSFLFHRCQSSYNFHLVSIVVQPLETDAPLIVNTNAMLAFPISAEGLQPVSWRRPQVIDTRRKMKLGEFAKREAFLIKDGVIVWADHKAYTKTQADEVLKVIASQKS